MLVHTARIAQYSTAHHSLAAPAFVHRNDQLRASRRDFLTSCPAVRRAPSYFRHRSHPKPSMLKKDDSDDVDSDYLISAVERVSNICATPTPGISPSLPLGYPLLLATAFFVLPVLSASYFFGFFVVYSFAGRKLVLDDSWEEQSDIDNSENNDETDDDEFSQPPTDLLALGASVASAALLVPDSDGIGGLLNAYDFPFAGAILVLTMGVSGFLLLGAKDERKNENESPEQQLMDLWDEQLSEQTDDEVQEKK